MFQKFRTDVLAELSQLDGETLHKVAQALDKVSGGYTFGAACTDIAVLGREHFKEVAVGYVITKKTEGMSPATLKQMARIVDQFIERVTKPIEQIRTNDIRGYLYGYQQERGITNRSLNLIRTIICGFFRWAAAEGYIPCDPSANIKPIKYTAKPRKALTQVELEKVRRACRTERETCIVEVLYSTGCRVSELCGILLSDVDFEKHEVMVLGKGGKYRTVYLNAKALVSIQEYLSTRKHASQFLICNDRGGGQLTKSNIEKMFSRIEKETGIRVTPHIMRHTFATQALTGTGVEVVQRILGHSNVATTMIYAEVDMRSVHAAHDKCVI